MNTQPINWIEKKTTLDGVDLRLTLDDRFPEWENWTLAWWQKELEWVERFRSSRAADVWVGSDPVYGKTWYLKRLFIRNERMDLLKQALRGTRGRRAFQNGLKMAKAGFRVPEHACLIEAFRFGRPLGSGLISVEVKNAGPLDEWLDRENDSQKRCKLIQKLGAEVAAFHKAGMFHGDLRRSNLMLHVPEEEGVFTWLDNERNRFSSRLSDRLKAHNLVRLNMEQDGVSLKERLVFWHAYRRAAGLSRAEAVSLRRLVLHSTQKRWRERGWLSS